MGQIYVAFSEFLNFSKRLSVSIFVLFPGTPSSGGFSAPSNDSFAKYVRNPNLVYPVKM